MPISVISVQITVKLHRILEFWQILANVKFFEVQKKFFRKKLQKFFFSKNIRKVFLNMFQHSF
jgi:hypothetical protein